MTRSVALVIGAGMATLHELDTVYGSQDLADMIEILSIDAHNQRVMTPPPGR